MPDSREEASAPGLWCDRDRAGAEFVPAGVSPGGSPWLKARLVAAALLGLGWAQAPEPPTFGARVDLASVDVLVVDGQGQPVADLRPSEFVLRVDGRPRRAVSADFVTLGRSALPVGRPTHFSSNADLPPGRLVLFAVDQSAIASGEGRLVMDAARVLLDQLTPADRAGLLAFPAPGPRIDLTADFAKLRDALGRVVGRGDLLAQPRMASSAMLSGLFRGLRLFAAPKTVILISARAWAEGPEVLRELAELAADANIGLYLLQIEPSAAGASFDGPAAPPGPADMRSHGLEALANLTHGELFRVSGSGRTPFERIARELSGHYVLGFSPELSDRDGRTHSLDVGVTRSGLTVRTRGRLKVPMSAGPGTAHRAQSLQALLSAPYLSADLPLRVATFPRPGSSGQCRLSVVAQIGQVGETLDGVSVGLRLIDARGQVVENQLRQLTSSDPSAPLEFHADLAVPVGLYTLRLAAVDARERGGSVEHPVASTLGRAAGLELSDLALLPAPGPEPLATWPRPSIDLELSGTPLGLAVELRAERSEPARERKLVFEVAEGERTSALLVAPAQLADLGSNHSLASARIELTALPPGSYFGRVVLLANNRRQVEIVRPFRWRGQPPAETATP